MLETLPTKLINDISKKLERSNFNREPSVLQWGQTACAIFNHFL
jgi:hypothetical protein